ncbi:MAG: hypothetical protein QM638_23175 [Nocardioides sp.]|uniref:hypothetical protein n=1 Tax=Nocardioides sp. TaxID=35761 RepID=UPI0039E214C9
MRLSDPLHAPSRQRLRTLKTARTASEGVRVVSREHGRARGSAVYYSALTALAAQARQRGDEQTEKLLSEAGGRIETSFRELLQGFLSSNSIDALPGASFYRDLVAATREAVERVWSNNSTDLIVGQIKSTRGDLVQIEGNFQGRAARIDLPTTLILQIDGQPGDYVWVLRRLIGSAALLTVLPAVVSDSEQTDGSVDAPNTDGPPDTEADDTYLRTGAGALISGAEAAFFATLEDDLPDARILRLAG